MTPPWTKGSQLVFCGYQSPTGIERIAVVVQISLAVRSLVGLAFFLF